MAKKIVSDLAVSGKRVLVRVDFNVPMKDGVITNDNRIVAALPTLKYLLENGAKVIAFSHLGKVKTAEDKKTKSLKAVADRLAQLLDRPVQFVAATRGASLENAVAALQDGQILLFENTRFETGETKNEAELGAYWAGLGDLFVNDAFGTAHRSHASNVGIAKHLETAAGFLMEKEIKYIGGVVAAPQRPLVAILGGAKVSDKIGVIESLIDKADKILIGGGMMFTFLKAQGKTVGKSLLEADKIDLAKSLLAKAAARGAQIILPIDVVLTKEFSNDALSRTASVDDIGADEMGLDIGPQTVALFSDQLEGARTVVWNGPMGVFEMSNFAVGTIGVCKAIAALQDCQTIIGGGDSAAAAIDLGFADQFSHISTGGGASLEYLEGKTLPGIAAINDK